MQREVQYAELEEQKKRMEWRWRCAMPRQSGSSARQAMQQAVEEGLARQQAVEEARREA